MSCHAYHHTPIEASRTAEHEKLIYVTCPRYNSENPDYLATVDVDPESKNYSQVIHRLEVSNAKDEIHHTGWDVCASCPDKTRSKLILPCLNSSRIYVIDVSGASPRLHTTIEPEELFKHNVSFPHTTHCLPTGELLISTLGDAEGNAKGSFISVDATTFKLNGLWENDNNNCTPFGYDYWYQPYHNVMVSSEWGDPNFMKQGFNPAHVGEGHYGHSLHIWKWHERTIEQVIELDPADGQLPLEVRFKHDPTSVHGFVGCALSSTVYHFYRTNEGHWTAHKVISVDPFDVTGWALPTMPGLITDILISMDDRFLFFSNWLHGDIRQYDITDPFNPKLVSQVFIGGSICKEGSVYMKNVSDSQKQPEKLAVKGVPIQGGPQMLQLSLDGKRLYVTTSLYSIWDKQFYPDLISKGAAMLKINVTDTGMKVDEEFLVDFGKEPGGPALAHEMRYPGGDCTSDIWLLP